MKLLILGGTMFLGRHLVESALERGHEVTIFNRGRHNPDLFPEVEKLRGDRDGDLAALQGGRWDACIDTCGFLPRIVRASVELLADSIERYVFISSLSVFADVSRPVENEDAPLAELPVEKAEEFSGENYAGLKVMCERAAEDAMPGRVLVIRPGLIVGPNDTTVRFIYWPRRVKLGGEVLAPGRPEKQIQVIDSRDLAAWTIRMTEQKQTGIFNATGPDYKLTMGQFLEECKQVTRSDARFTWADEKFLIEHEVEQWTGLPLWLAEETGDHQYFLSINCDKAIAAGLTFRPVAATIRDTLEWDDSRADKTLFDKAGLPMPDVTLRPERERELLAAWHEQHDAK